MAERTIPMPFGKGYLYIKIPERNLQKVYYLNEPPNLMDEEKELEIRLKNPIQSKPVSALVGPQDKVCIILSDITRPVPNDRILTALLKELRNISRKNITGVIATGLHRKNTKDELRSILGNHILNEIKVINHDAFDNKKLRYIGKTSRGTELFINKYVMNSDKIIMTGYIEPHEFAGFTGGRKSLLPGVSGADTINHNHGLENLDHPKAKIGILDGNPIHEDMVEAARIAGVDFIVNVVLDSKKRITNVVAGDVVEAHQAGVKFYTKYAEVDIGNLAEIVITSSGYPLDINLYQAVKSIIAAEPFVAPGGIIILLAECKKGLGTDIFYSWMRCFSSPRDIINKIQEEGYRADIDHCYFLARILEKKDIVIVSAHPSMRKIRSPLIKVAYSTEEAIAYALNKKGRDASIAFLPHAQRIIPKIKSEQLKLL